MLEERLLKQAGRPTFFPSLVRHLGLRRSFNRSRVCYVAVNEVVVDKWAQ